MRMKNIIWRKRLLIGLIVVTAAAPAFFLRLDEPTYTLKVYKLLAKAGSLCGTVLILWQFLLGFRAAAGKWIIDLLWVFNVHKNVGRYVLFLIALHPIFITLYYLEKEGINPLILQGQGAFPAYVLLGLIAFGLFAVIVSTSVFLRPLLSLYAWYGIHMTGYLALPLVFVHSLFIGRIVRETGLFWPWIGMMGVTGFLFLFRIAFQLGFLIRPHEVSHVQEVGPRVVKITARPMQGKVGPGLGQFIYLRRGLLGLTRPFTVSHYKERTGEVSVTVKAQGRFTSGLQNIKPGEKVYIDGPYGVFSHAALESERPIVMVAGGIGITPFIRIFEELEYEPGLELHLFYANKRKHEIIYREQIENVEHIRVIHVLSREQEQFARTGRVSADLLKEYLLGDLKGYEYLICGPPPMIRDVEAGLIRSGVPYRRIHHELFDY